MSEAAPNSSNMHPRPRPAGTRPRRGPTYRRTLLLGRPMHFGSIDQRPGGPNDARPLIFRGKPDRDAALRQWGALADLLTSRGFDVIAIPPDKKLPELAFAGAAGYLPDRSLDTPLEEKKFIVASRHVSERTLTEAFERTIRGIGFRTEQFADPFAGAADFFRCGERYIFTYGLDEEKQSGMRLPMFLGGRRTQWGSSPTVAEQLSDFTGGRETVQLRMIDPRFPRGDLVCHAIGPNRAMMMIYVNAFDTDSRALILSGKARVADYIIPLSEADAAMYAANSFQFTEKGGKQFMIIAEGVSNELLRRIEAVGITPILIDLSAWIRKDRGSVRSMVADLGWISTEARGDAQPIEFRRSLRYQPAEPTSQSVGPDDSFAKRG